MTIGVNDFPWGNCGCSGGLNYANGGCGLRQCTDFCAWRIRNDAHRNVSCPGEAKDWANWGRGQGFAVNSNPNRAANEIVIMVMQPGVNGAFGTGHVASVIGVDTRYPGTVNVEQYNYCNECCCYSQKQLPSARSEYVHIPILGAPSPTPTPQPPPPTPTPMPPPAPTPGLTGDTTLAGLAILGGAGVVGWWYAKRHGMRPVIRGQRAFGTGAIGITHVRPVPQHISGGSILRPRSRAFE